MLANNGLIIHEPGHAKMWLMLYANNKGADQPAHPCSLISTFVVRCLDSIISLVSSSNFKILARLRSWAGWFECYLVANSWRYIFAWRGSHNKGQPTRRGGQSIMDLIITSADGPRQENLVLIAYASSEGSGEPAHPRSLARTSATRSYKHRVKRNLQTESQIPGPSEWLGMRS